MRFKTVCAAFAAVLAIPLAGGCATTSSDTSEPRVVVQEVKVPVPVPCPALAELGPEPVYVDTDEAIANAPSFAARAQLYVIGRAQRVRRLTEYTAVKAACAF